ncbi:PREDICTED: tripartite motif-containing protein 16-like protein [Tinamus guttatus]|uniref:tripartite motif-containing protein 16-like protein n=1 Tax=Tinamus guttatus TaxID=94827 RepID=UPI00052E92C4|nr:PREDICTED: tripartite motif-containing protein 16-like protein [Tinamus guttatus]
MREQGTAEGSGQRPEHAEPRGVTTGTTVMSPATAEWNRGGRCHDPTSLPCTTPAALAAMGSLTEQAEIKQAQTNLENQILMVASDSLKHKARVIHLTKVVERAREEVNRGFAEILQELRQLHRNLLGFLDQEEHAALLRLGDSIQERQEKLEQLRKQDTWLTGLLEEASEEQLRQEFPKVKETAACSKPVLSPKCEESSSFMGLKQSLSELKTQVAAVGLCFVKKIGGKGITMLNNEVVPADTDRKSLLKYYCELNWDTSTASEELLLLQETRSALNVCILLDAFVASCPGFGCWPQVACSRSLCEGRHYWEAEVSDSWLCLGATYSRQRQAGKSHVFYLMGRNSASWCLEWDSLQLSAWHDNVQTTLKGGYYRTIGVFLDYAAGSLTFYGITNTPNLIYRFLATFTEPLYPAFMVSSGGSITLKRHPE